MGKVEVRRKVGRGPSFLTCPPPTVSIIHGAASSEPKQLSVSEVLDRKNSHRWTPGDIWEVESDSSGLREKELSLRIPGSDGGGPRTLKTDGGRVGVQTPVLLHRYSRKKELGSREVHIVGTSWPE